mmetsp:Transcript_29980/g.45455  ORF Transcript_29980/g.45455 Transcript_29980/m.45455 type:complete len:465 (+) Transcript_29980:140-1534(+)
MSRIIIHFCFFLVTTTVGCQALSTQMVLPASHELFSVAPMMGHTNRHYHYFFRLLSQKAHLYTEMIPATQIVSLANDDNSQKRLDDLLRTHTPLTLQLGGNDAKALGQACRIVSQFYVYTGVNLNCGCPSNAVSGRCGGAALMEFPEKVATIVDVMKQNLSEEMELSVKHRLGIANFATYDRQKDIQTNSDDDVFQSCWQFAKAITDSGAVTKLQVHARLALLGDIPSDDNESSSSLWIPNSHDTPKKDNIKIDHKRQQYQAQKRARLATIHNRSIPPLRPKVIYQLAEALPHICFVTNGGVQCLKDVVSHKNIMGAMVGRAVINHPCSFATADDLWGGAPRKTYPTRGQVLEEYADYCAREEERVFQWITKPSMQETLKRRLVAVPFTLFWNEPGNNAYQRRIRKLIRRPQRHSSSQILRAALAEVPRDIQDKVVSEYFSESANDDNYSQYNLRSGPLQRSIL